MTARIAEWSGVLRGARKPGVLLGRYGASMVGGWWQRRRERRAKQEARRRQLQVEYEAKLGRCDSDVLESSRDFGDNDATTWRTEVSMALVGVGILALLVCVGLLIGVFSVIQHLTGS